MPTTFTKLKLQGVVLVTPKVFSDPRGYFMETYNEAEFQQEGIASTFVQDNQSCSSYGVIRGLHYQQAPYTQGKLVRVLMGKIFDVVVDVRPQSPTFKQSLAIELDSNKHEQLFVPRGFLHGFAVLSEQAIVAYKCDAFYQPQAELTVRYDDPELNIAWPIAPEERLISQKDITTGLSLTTFLSRLN